MKNPQNITIALLITTAVILTGMLVTMHVDATPVAQADAPGRVGEYIAVSGAYSTKYDVMYVADVVAGKLNAYMVDPQSKTIQLIDSVDLARMFAAE